MDAKKYKLEKRDMCKIVSEEEARELDGKPGYDVTKRKGDKGKDVWVACGKF